MRRFIALGVLPLVVLAFGCGNHSERQVVGGASTALPTGAIVTPITSPVVQPTILQAIQQDPRLTTLATAVQVAGLAQTLQGPGPFTVFAPTNEAFNQLPAGTLNSLLNDPAALARVLQFHVLPGIFTASQLSTTPTLTTAAGLPLTFTTVNGQLVINQGTNNAGITQANIVASNGVIHAINAVLVPPAP